MDERDKEELKNLWDQDEQKTWPDIKGKTVVEIVEVNVRSRYKHNRRQRA